MGDLKVNVKFRDDTTLQYLLGVDDVSEIEEGSLFGLIISRDNIHSLIPSIEYNGSNGNLLYNIDYPCIGSESENFGLGPNELKNEVPLIFIKLNRNLAQELLSGEIFALTGAICRTKYIDARLTAKDFQTAETIYSDNAAIINCFIIKEHRVIKTPNAFFQVSDRFKLLYGELTLPHKDEIINALKSINIESKKYWDEGIIESIESLKKIAEIDNEIFDLVRPYEQKNGKKSVHKW